MNFRTLFFSGLSLSLVFSGAVSNSSAFADTAVQLLHGTTDASTQTGDVQLLVDADNIITGFQAVSGTTSKQYDLSQIKTGIVLMVYQGTNVATLTSTDFDPSHGGTLQITYLHDALDGSYQSVTVDLVKNGSTWELMTNDQSGHQVVTQAFLKANKFLGQVVGVDSVTFH